MEFQDLLDQKEIQDQKGSMVLRVTLGQPDHKAREVIQEQLDHKDHLDQWA